MFTGATHSGFGWSINSALNDDWLLVRAQDALHWMPIYDTVILIFKHVVCGTTVQIGHHYFHYSCLVGVTTWSHRYQNHCNCLLEWHLPWGHFHWGDQVLLGILHRGRWRFAADQGLLTSLVMIKTMVSYRDGILDFPECQKEQMTSCPMDSLRGSRVPSGSCFVIRSVIWVQYSNLAIFYIEELVFTRKEAIHRLQIPTPYQKGVQFMVQMFKNTTC